MVSRVNTIAVYMATGEYSCPTIEYRYHNSGNCIKHVLWYYILSTFVWVTSITKRPKRLMGEEKGEKQRRMYEVCERVKREKGEEYKTSSCSSEYKRWGNISVRQSIGSVRAVPVDLWDASEVREAGDATAAKRSPSLKLVRNGLTDDWVQGSKLRSQRACSEIIRSATCLPL